jgi:hypothetical protein
MKKIVISVGVVLSVFGLALVVRTWMDFSQARTETLADACARQLKQIGLAAKIYAVDHGNVYPPSFQSFSNELGNVSLLICPSDPTKTPANNWSLLTPQNISYEWAYQGTNKPGPGTVLVRCPFHSNVVLGDCSVQNISAPRTSR